jgi:hypothetical protein
MPTRSDCIVRCATCGVRWGSVKRAAAFEEAADVERGILAAETPRMIRHWTLGHRLELGPNAPREFLAVIAEAARRVAAQRGGGWEAEPVGDERRRLGAIED